MPESLLDDVVMTAVAEGVLASAHLSDLLQNLFNQHARELEERVLPALLARKGASDAALKGLYATVPAVPEAAEEKNYREDLSKALREAKLIERALEKANSIRVEQPKVTPEKIETFARKVRDLLHGDNSALAKQVLQSIVSRVEVTDETIVIMGEKEQLRRLVPRREREATAVLTARLEFVDMYADGGETGIRTHGTLRYESRWNVVPQPGDDERARAFLLSSVQLLAGTAVDPRRYRGSF